MRRQTYDIIQSKVQQKSLNMHYNNLNKIKTKRTNRLSTSLNIPTIPNLKKQKIQEQKIIQIEKNNMILFTKISNIYNRDAFNKSIKKVFKRHSNQRSLAFSQLKIQMENRNFYDRLCLLKPTINNQKILQQRKKQLKILKYLGRFSEHNIQSQSQLHHNYNSHRIHSEKSESPDPALKIKTQGNQNDSQGMNSDNRAYKPSKRPIFKRKPHPLELKYSNQHFHNQINGQLNLLSRRYVHQNTEIFSKVLKTTKNTTLRQSLTKQKLSAQQLGEIIVYSCTKQLNKNLYNVKILKKQSFYEIVCEKPQEYKHKLTLKISQQKCQEMLSLISYNYPLFLSFLQLKNKKLCLSFKSYKFSQNNRNQTIFSHISELNEEESLQPLNTDTIEQEDEKKKVEKEPHPNTDAQQDMELEQEMNKVEKTRNNFYQFIHQKSKYYKKIKQLSNTKTKL